MDNSIQTYAGFKVFHEHKLIVEFRKGPFNLDILKEFRLAQAQDLDFDPAYDVLGDNTELIPNDLISCVEQYVAFLKKYQEIMFSDRKCADICANAHQLVYISEYSRKHQQLPQNHKYFIDFQEALKFLERAELLELVKSTLEEIKREPMYEFKMANKNSY